MVPLENYGRVIGFDPMNQGTSHAPLVLVLRIWRRNGLACDRESGAWGCYPLFHRLWRSGFGPRCRGVVEGVKSLLDRRFNFGWHASGSEVHGTEWN